MKRQKYRERNSEASQSRVWVSLIGPGAELELPVCRKALLSLLFIYINLIHMPKRVLEKDKSKIIVDDMAVHIIGVQVSLSAFYFLSFLSL